MDLSNEEVHTMVENMRNELEGLLDTEPVEGYAAEDEIEEAVEHLKAASSDLEQGMLNE